MASLTFNPSAFDSGSYSSISNQTNPVGKSQTNTTYATITCKTGSRASSYAQWKFDCSSIPSTATINSVACVAKCYVSSTSYITTRAVQLYVNSGTGTAKGSAVTFSNSTSATQTLTCGTWTRSELDNIVIRLTGTRGTSQTTRTASMRFYGATLTVTYTYEEVKYTVTSSITKGTLISESPAQVVSGNSFEVQFKGNDDCEFKSMTVNGTSVTPTPAAVSWDVTTNYSTYQTYNIANCHDGDTSTYFWSSEAQTTGKYILVTFDSAVKLNKFETYSSNSTDMPKNNNVLQVSSNGSDWETVGTFTNNSTTSFTNINKSNVKYARIYAQSDISNWLVLNEITIEAEVSGSTYSYTISSVTSDTTVIIIFEQTSTGSIVYIKLNGVWTQGTPYKKVGGVWTQISPEDIDTTLKYNFYEN